MASRVGCNVAEAAIASATEDLWASVTATEAVRTVLSPVATEELAVTPRVSTACDRNCDTLTMPPLLGCSSIARSAIAAVKDISPTAQARIMRGYHRGFYCT